MQDIDTPQPQSPASSNWSVPRAWLGDTAFIVGGGPSLRGFNPERLRGRGRVIVINRMVLPSADGVWPGIPWADVMYFCDEKYWRVDGARVREFYKGGCLVTMARLPNDPDIHRLSRRARVGLSPDPRQLCHGSNSGFQAINLAYLFGARRIILLGIDMAIGEDGRTHTHEGYGPCVQEVELHLKAVFLPKFPSLVKPLKDAGVEVINASPRSALTCWPRVSIDEALALS